MTLTAIDDADIFDGLNAELIPGGSVLIEDGRIVEVGAAPIRSPSARRINAQGHFLMPGLIDLHTHAYVSDVDVAKVDCAGEPYRTAHGIKVLGQALDCGFTTVRDVGGGDWSIARAIEDGLIRAPRYFYSGRILSMTGGHGDFRKPGQHHHENGSCMCGAFNSITTIADGVDECIKAAREQLRRGAHCLKIMASGGVASPTDPIWAPQYREDEIRAVVGEASARRTYVAAHCNPAAAIRRAVECGVRTIEHGALIDSETARFVRDQGAYVVPTVIAFVALVELGGSLGFPAESQAKAKIIADHAMQALDILRAESTSLGFGTDLIGELYVHRSREITLRREVFTPLEILRQLTSQGAEILMQKDQLGSVSAGAHADLILVRGNPLNNLDLLTSDGRDIAMIMQAGKITKSFS